MILKEKEKQTYVIPDIGSVERKPFYTVVKRIFDIAVSLLALVVLILPMSVIALFIYCDIRGDVLFKQERLGKDGKPFMMYKFRTMYMNAEQDGPRWADKIDHRCTRVGRVLRKTRLDELPQLWNILKGDMSIVGPRPERAYFYNIFETYIKGFSQRTKVIPGLTGWAQVNGGYDLKPEEKIIYDMEYITKRSIAMDLKCIFMTVRIIFTGSGAR